MKIAELGESPEPEQTVLEVERRVETTSREIQTYIEVS